MPSDRSNSMPSPNTLFLQAAIEEARKGLDEGGIPIGSVLVIDNQIVGRGHNRRVQKGSAILHAEMDALENAGRLTARDYRRSVLYSTLSPCDMCSGTALLYQIPRIVIGENRTFQGPEEYVRSRGVVLEIVDDPECVQMMKEFIRSKPELWNEDIGELKIAQSDSNPPTISLSRKPLALLTGRSRCRSAGCDLRRGDAIVASLGTGQANRLLRV